MADAATNREQNVGFIQREMSQDKPAGADAGMRFNITQTSGTWKSTSSSSSSAVQRRRETIDWRFPALAIVLFCVSIGLAGGHHAYYQSLDGTLADGGGSSVDASKLGRTSMQTWAIRIGTGFAFLQKAALVGVMALVGAQQVWVTLRRKAMTIDGIDAMFGIMTNPLSIFNRDLVAHAKLLLLLAIVAWFIPLVAVVTPATLSVVTRALASQVDMDVATTNFSDVTRWMTTEGPGYVETPSIDISTLFSNVYSSFRVVALPAPLPNASYEQTLYGPSYKCISLAEAVATDNAPTWDRKIEASPDYSKYASLEDAFYGELEIERTTNNKTIDNYRRAYSAVAPIYMNSKILVSAGGRNDRWDGTYNGVVPETLDNGTILAPQGSNFVCQLYNTSFRVAMRFENGEQSIVPLDVKHLQPQNMRDSDGMFSMVMSMCTEGYCGPLAATYYITHQLFAYLLGGRLTIGASGGLTYTASANASRGGQTTAPLMQSALMHCPDITNLTMFSFAVRSSFAPDAARCRNGTLAAAIEDLSRNFTFSTLTFSGWSGNATERARVTTSATRVFFTYNARTLVASYAAAIAVTFAAMLVGAHALWRNGVVSSTSFSAALLTTRNAQLDGLVRSPEHVRDPYLQSLGAKPLDDRIGRLRLRFGHLDPAADNNDRAGFGLEGSVVPLRSRTWGTM